MQVRYHEETKLLQHGSPDVEMCQRAVQAESIDQYRCVLS